MNRTLLALALLLLALGSGTSTAAAAEEAAPKRPHIVVFLSDDHTLRDSSLYGSRELATPNMERLAAAGMTFDRAFVVSPSCAPSRAALLTGLMPSRNGAEANHSRPRKEIKKLPAYFQELGYEVVAFGKVGHYKQTPEYGWDHAAHFNYHEDVCVEKGIEWLRKRESEKPLCLFVGTNWPHVPWPEAEAYKPGELTVPANHIDTPRTRQARAKYYEAVRTMDADLGRVYDAARERLGDDVLFLHTSDHGAQWPFGKWTLYDDGIRTPLIVSWPGRIEAGTRSGAFVTWVDILPTLLEAAGGETPQGIDGRSFLPVLRGEAKVHREQVFTTHSGDGNFNVYPARSVRTERWKYIRNLHPEYKFTSHITSAGRADEYWASWERFAAKDLEAARIVGRHNRRPAEELYDLEADPLEQKNLAAEPAHAAVLAELRAALDGWLKEQGDTQRVFGEPQLLD